MKTVTFYSYKGGVGRTLALANVAADIALLGESLFLIDFDLEAPGLQTMSFLNGKIPDLGLDLNEANRSGDNEIPGLSDLVLEYIENPEAGLPNLKKYVVESKEISELDTSYGGRKRQWKSEEHGSVWFLPAGSRKAFEQINWQELYDKYDGYLFFEALKGEIEDTYNADWLFIDSRTGRAETSGICTRQMADTNVLVFFPNKQNLVGFQEIYDMFVNEPSRAEAEKEELEFVYLASRIPTSDDEENILADQLEEFAKAFHLASPEQIIQLPHNSSLNLLSQDLFSLKRPKSSLARGYFEVTDKLLSLNKSSLLGARQYFDRRIMPKWFDAYYGRFSISGSDEPKESVNDILNRALNSARMYSGDEILNNFLSGFYMLVASAPSAGRELQRDDWEKAKYRAVFHKAVSFHLLGDKKIRFSQRDFVEIASYIFASMGAANQDPLVALDVTNLLEKAYEEPSQDQKHLAEQFGGKKRVRAFSSVIDEFALSYDINEESDEDEIAAVLQWFSVSGNSRALEHFAAAGRLEDFALKSGRVTAFLTNRIDELLDLEIGTEVKQVLEGLRQRLLEDDDPPLHVSFSMQPSEISLLVDDEEQDDLDSERLTDEANRLMRTGRMDEAVPLYKQLLASEPGSLAFKFNLALSQKLIGIETSEALAALVFDFQQEERRGRRDANFFQCFGLVLFYSDRIDEAKSKFQRAITEAGNESQDIFSCFDYREISKTTFVEQCFEAISDEEIVSQFSFMKIRR